jgi:hypothetical protein
MHYILGQILNAIMQDGGSMLGTNNNDKLKKKLLNLFPPVCGFSGVGYQLSHFSVAQKKLSHFNFVHARLLQKSCSPGLAGPLKFTNARKMVF